MSNIHHHGPPPPISPVATYPLRGSAAAHRPTLPPPHLATAPPRHRPNNPTNPPVLTLAHANTIPVESMGVFLRTFPWTIHATGYMLIPSVAALGMGLVASTALHGNEDNAVVALGCLGLVGTTVIWSAVGMHLGGLAIRSAALRSQIQAQAAARRVQRQMAEKRFKR